MANGDNIHFTYQTTGAIKNGQMQSGSNKWQATGRSDEILALIRSCGLAPSKAR